LPDVFSVLSATESWLSHLHIIEIWHKKYFPSTCHTS
jgi:hypothetical protein